MGCCVSTAPVANDANDSNDPNSEGQAPTFPEQNVNNNSIPDSGNLANLDSLKKNKDDTFNLKTISENNQINDYDVDYDYDSYDDEYNLEGYKYEKKIGYGGSAEVVQMSKDGVPYAVKIIDLNKAKNNYLESDHTPKEEVAILKQFNHAHVVKFIDFIDDQDRNKLYIVMELLDGGTIMECKTYEEKREAFTQALSAVQYIHFQRIAHQDIKPANILRSKAGTVKLVDFGSAVFVEEGKKTIPAGIIGTPFFTPPEKFSSKFYDPFAGDVWSLGVTLYNMVYGKLPFDGSDIFQVQNHISNSEPQFPKNDEFKDAIDLMKLMLKKNPIDRIKVDQICEHPFILQSSTTSSLKSLFDSSSRIFESLKGTDTINSMTRISRGSLGSSLMGKSHIVTINPSKTSFKRKPQKPKRNNQKPQSQLITAPKAKLNIEKQKQTQKRTQNPIDPNNKVTKQETDQNLKTESINNNNNTNNSKINNNNSKINNNNSKINNNSSKVNNNKEQEPINEPQNIVFVVDIDSEPSFQDDSDDKTKPSKPTQSQTSDKLTKQKGSTNNRDQVNKSKKQENDQEKVPENQQKPKDTKKTDKKPGSSKKQFRDNTTEIKPSNSRKSKHEIQIDTKPDDSLLIKPSDRNKNNSQKELTIQESKQDSPRKPKDGNTSVRSSTNKPLKPRRQSKQFTPKKE